MVAKQNLSNASEQVAGVLVPYLYVVVYVFGLAVLYPCLSLSGSRLKNKTELYNHRSKGRITMGT